MKYWKHQVTLFCYFLLICWILCASPVFGDENTSLDSYQLSSQPMYNISIEKDWLTMNDGVNLSVTYIKPVAMEQKEKFPVLLEMLPYRKDDMFYNVDYQKGAYFAKRGYVYTRVDVRGTGTSNGSVPISEYSEAELSDGEEIIDQLSRASWSNGKVGMFGKSWAGFNSLMLAARKPPALKAIIVAHASDDLYYNDIHYIDGVFHLDTYEPEIVTDNALPAPDQYLITPEYISDRFDQEPWIFLWKRNQTPESSLWTDESIRYKPDLTVPVYLIGGLLDGYRDTIPRIMNSSDAPVKADIGPWNHIWPNDKNIGPNYEWQEKAVRWWDYWLKGIDTGILDEPRFMVFVRDAVPPTTDPQIVPGEWRCGDWPVEGIGMHQFFPTEKHRLDATLSTGNSFESLPYRAGSAIGIQDWWGELTGDMADDDRYGMWFDSETLKEPVEIIGNPRITLNISADAPRYYWTVRLEDLWPDGKVSLVSGTLINPSHQFDNPDPKPLEPDTPTVLSADIHYTTWTFKPGHSIRVAVSNSQFPMGWPTPYPGNTTLYFGNDTSMYLPVVEKNILTDTCSLPEPGPIDNRGGYTVLPGDLHEYPIYYNETSGEAVSSWGTDYRFSINTTVYHYVENNTWQVNDHDPAHATYTGERIDTVTMGNRVLNLTDVYTLTSDEEDFNLTLIRVLKENGEVIREKTWNEIIPREYQ
jgi:hypothetical protein